MKKKLIVGLITMLFMVSIVWGIILREVPAGLGAIIFALAGMFWCANKIASWMFSSKKEEEDKSQKEIEVLRDDNEKLRKERESLNAELRSTQSALEKKEGVEKTIRQAWDNLCKEKRESLDKNERLSQEKEALLKEAVDLRTANKELGADNKFLHQDATLMIAKIEQYRKKMRRYRLLANFCDNFCRQHPGIASSVVWGFFILLISWAFPHLPFPNQCEVTWNFMNPLSSVSFSCPIID